MYIQVFLSSTKPTSYPFPFYGPHKIKLLSYNMVYKASRTENGNVVYTTPQKWAGVVSRTLRNPSQLTPCLFIFSVVPDVPTLNSSVAMAESASFECSLNGSVDFEIIDASTSLSLSGLDVDCTQMVLAFEVEKIKELSTRHN